MRELIGSFARCRDGRPTTSAPAHSPLAPPIHHSHHPFTTRTTHSPPAPPIHHPLNADAGAQPLRGGILRVAERSLVLADRRAVDRLFRARGIRLRRRRSAGGE